MEQAVKTIACPKCGSNNVIVQAKQKMQHQSHPLFWWIFLGWIWVLYLMMKWMLIGMYWICIKWWVDIIQNAQRKKQGLPPKRKVTCVCQDCGCVF